MLKESNRSLSSYISEYTREKLPHNYEAESYCLGAILVENTLLDQVFSRLEAEDFYDLRHRVIARSLLELAKTHREVPLDIITFPDYLESKSRLEEAGGVAYLTELIENVTSIDNIIHYVEIVKEDSNFRKLVGIGSRIITLSLKKDQDFEGMVQQSQQFLHDLLKDKYRDFKDFKTILKRLIEEIEKNYKNRENPDMALGVNTGFRKLDDLLLGIKASNFVVIGGRPSMGKSAFAISIIQNVAVDAKQKLGIGLFSLEMTAMEVAYRMVSSQARVTMEKIRKNVFDESDWTNIFMAVEKMSKSTIFIDDTPRITLQEMSYKARRMVELGADIIFVDYLQLMSSPEMEAAWSREQFIASISRGLKLMARELEVPVVALTQLNRGLESREDKTPRLSDIRESGSIEQDADIVCFIHRDSVYETDENKKEAIKNQSKIIVAKNRHGKTGSVELSFQENYARFENLSTEMY